VKKLLILLLVLSLSIGIVACSGSDLEKYQAAMEKTDNIIKASESFEMNIKTNYNSEGLDEETKRLVESFQDTKLALTGSFDKDLKRSLKMGYLNFGDLGYDFNVYEIEDKYFIEPFFLNLKDHRFIELSMDDFDTSQAEVPEELFEKTGDKWNELLNEENVMKGEKVLITTDDGEVKSSEFTITLNDQQLKEFLVYVVELFEENGEYLNIMEQTTYIKDEVKLTESEKQELYKETFSTLKEFLKNTENLELFYKAYIDIDNYVVQEDIKFSMDSDAVDSGDLLNLEFTMTNKYWNIEKNQVLDFELPTSENTIKIEDVDIEEYLPQMEAD